MFIGTRRTLALALSMSAMCRRGIRASQNMSLLRSEAISKQRLPSINIWSLRDSEKTKLLRDDTDLFGEPFCFHEILTSLTRTRTLVTSQVRKVGLPPLFLSPLVLADDQRCSVFYHFTGAAKSGGKPTFLT
jgi:hypothetical protein